MEVFGLLARVYGADDENPDVFECWVEAESEEAAKRRVIDQFGSDVVDIHPIQNSAPKAA